MKIEIIGSPDTAPGARGGLCANTWSGRTNRSLGVSLCESIVQNHIQQRLINPDAAVVFDEAELAEAIHEEADAGAGGADHLRQSFLRDGRNQMFWLIWFTEFRKNQKNSRQAPFAGVKKLVDKICLGSHTLDQKKF